MDEARYLRPQDMPDIRKCPEYYVRMFDEGRLRILREKPCVSVHPRHSVEEVARTVRAYLRPIDILRDTSWSEEDFEGMMLRMLSDRTVHDYLTKAHCKNGVRPVFNTWSLYKLVGYLRLRNVYRTHGEGSSQRDVELLLEGKLTGYHSHMGKGVPIKVEEAVKAIIKSYYTLPPFPYFPTLT